MPFTEPQAAAPVDLTRLPGLTESEAGNRLRTYGFNELPSAKPPSRLLLLLRIMREPMLLLLVACGLIYLFLGSDSEAALLLFFVTVIIAISFHQSIQTEGALQALRALTSPRALVVRDRRIKRIPGQRLVPGDLLILKEGDRVAADARILSSFNLFADESLLTGESVPVLKEASRHTEIYSGTLVTSGEALAEVIATGGKSRLGRIGKSLHSIEQQFTGLQVSMRRAVKVFAFLGLGCCAGVALFYWLHRGDLLPAILVGLTAAMALIPEELPVILSVFTAVGAFRISKKRVLTRSLPAIENLGAITTLCVDKTGTLTMNQMQVAILEVDGHILEVQDGLKGDLPEVFHPLIEFAVLSSHPAQDPFDPMEKAIRDLSLIYLKNTEHLHQDWTLTREYPLSSQLMAMTCVWKSPSGKDFIIAAKGAPEAIGNLCHLSEKAARKLAESTADLAEKGLRVISVARAKFHPAKLPSIQHDFNFELIGCIGLKDPIRPRVAQSIEECHRAGIRVIMMTGDSPLTARAIARELGIAGAPRIRTGQEIESYSEVALQKVVGQTDVFARVHPEHKLRLVQALQSGEEVVAMTGDGINDGPGLKAADIGIAMGNRGTDVAREASDLVLLDDNFASIVDAIRSGRRIYDNIRNATAYIFAVHIPIAGMALIPVMLDRPLALLPAHVMFLQLIIDPVGSLAFEAEPETPETMNRPPRRHNEPFFSRNTVLRSLLQGSILFILVAVLFFGALDHPLSAPVARAMAFTTLVVGNLGLVWINRSSAQSIHSRLKTKNRALTWVTGLALFSLLFSIYFAPLARLFSFAPLTLERFGVSLGFGFAALITGEAIRRILKPG